MWTSTEYVCPSPRNVLLTGPHGVEEKNKISGGDGARECGTSFIVTGGVGSIGGAVAKEIIKRGGIALIFDILPQEAGEAKVKELFAANKAFYFKTDITDVVALAAACDAALKVIPEKALAGGVHCAAISKSRPWTTKLKDSAKDFSTCLHVNSYGTFAVDAAIADAINSQYPDDDGPFGPRVTQERGSIVNIASVVASPVPARCLTYGPSKTAVLGITEAMADFLGPYGIRVNSVSPAIVNSAMLGAHRVPYFTSELEAAVVFPRRFTEPEEIADSIVYLLANSMMNSFHLRVDGSWRASSNWGGPNDPRKTAPALE